MGFGVRVTTEDSYFVFYAAPVPFMVGKTLPEIGCWTLKKFLALGTPYCLQCFDAVGWATGRASGL